MLDLQQYNLDSSLYDVDKKPKWTSKLVDPPTKTDGFDEESNYPSLNTNTPTEQFSGIPEKQNMFAEEQYANKRMSDVEEVIDEPFNFQNYAATSIYRNQTTTDYHNKYKEQHAPGPTPQLTGFEIEPYETDPTWGSTGPELDEQRNIMNMGAEHGDTIDVDDTPIIAPGMGTEMAGAQALAPLPGDQDHWKSPSDMGSTAIDTMIDIGGNKSKIGPVGGKAGGWNAKQVGQAQTVAAGAQVVAAGIGALDGTDEFDAPDYAANILGSAASGAAMGATFGPWGAAVGGVVGAGVGTIKSISADKKQRAASLKRKNEMDMRIAAMSKYKVQKNF